MSPLVSVIVPIYNVEPYLNRCLDSVVAQARTCRLDVLLVDDGSTDRSASIAEEYAERHAFMTVIRKPNGGLGDARNVGAARARGDYVAFLDSDDVLPDGTYGAMMGALSDPRVDFVTGNVARLRGQATAVSAAHQKSHPTDRRATHISQHPGLLWDTTAWNKMFRRRFWEDWQLAFPVGVLYEDMELMTRSHLLARQVAVLERVCYLWRIRTEWPPSITQCRTDVQNLDDRFTAIFALFDTMDQLGTPELREAYEHKVLSLDVPIYLRHYGRNDTQPYRDRLQAYVKRVMQQCTTDAVSRVSTVDRLKYWLVTHGRADDVAEVNKCQDTHFDTCPLTVRGGRVRRTYPPLSAGQPAVPAGLTDVTDELSPHTCIYEVRCEDRSLMMDIHAFVPGIPPETSGAMVRRFYLKHAESGHRVDLEAQPWSTRVTTAMLQALHFDGSWSRVTLRLPVDAFVEQAGRDLPAQWEVYVDCELAGLVWSDRVRRRDGEYMDRDRFVDCNDRRVRASLSRDDRLEVLVEPIVVRARCDATDRDTRAFSVVLPDGEREATLVLHGDHGAVCEWQLETAGTDQSWDVSRMRLIAAMAESGLNRAAVAVRIPAGEYRVTTPPGFEREWTTAAGQLVRVAGNPDGFLTVTRWQAGFRIVHLSLSPRGVLRLQIGEPGREHVSSDVCVEMVHTDAGSRLRLRPMAGNEGRHEVDLAQVDRWSFETAVSLGEWHIVARREGSNGTDVALQVAAHLRHALPVRSCANGVCLCLRVNDMGQAVLRVTTDWPEHADLHAKRRGLETGVYPVERARPVTQSAVFESWGGTSFSDGPRRIYDDLSRRVPHAELTWIVRDRSVWVPPGVRTALRGTREYFEALGRARYVVTNSRMPEHFHKREGCTYVRLGRGIPLKRIGMDATGVASLGVSAIRRQTADARQWDVLVTGHPSASRLYRSAFDYHGTMLDAGQPRLDGLVGADAMARRQQVRTLLGVGAFERVLLYAPTWRDNLFAKPGRYVMPQGLDISGLLDALGHPWRLLLKNHPFVGDRTGGRLDRRVINASAYPEMTDLYLAADVLVTDYSSALFDFAVTGKPILVFAPDRDEFRDRVRGVYWDMDTDLPCPVVESTTSLVEHLHELSAVVAQWQPRFREFHHLFCRLEDGLAARRVVESVFADWLD